MGFVQSEVISHTKHHYLFVWLCRQAEMSCHAAVRTAGSSESSRAAVRRASNLLAVGAAFSGSCHALLCARRTLIKEHGSGIQSAHKRQRVTIPVRLD